MHTLVVGITESGKTTLCKKLAAAHVKEGFAVLALSAIYDDWPTGVLLFDDQEKFLQIFWASKRCMVFIDEGKKMMGRYNEAMEETTTRGRHWGHSVYVCGQSAIQINPTVRGQCSQLFCFAQGTKAAETLAEEWRCEELNNAPDLMQGEFYKVLRFGKDRKLSCEKLDAFKF